MPEPVTMPRTLYDKIWDDHVVYVNDRDIVCIVLISLFMTSDIQDDGLALIYIDRWVPAVHVGRVVIFVLGISYTRLRVPRHLKDCEYLSLSFDSPGAIG